ncbi:TetR/AcrR family transcriptional regulator [Trinickia caryophylli]|uniref:Transcriptional regulator, TetR family n=1 Tax=Trinickia caryophylli TaxID=28094 RepID=A0A1X7D2Y6_TRICW|nr:TetR/AcrR family transcriptional regulator [Trinickia caryophylli]PMS12777.1 TetR/AcrR family transcriptional regulator [Trinickia caryophylli]TRX15191.1 TetR/AcrR family transcriptional regulator [Trinickia caryophylli]WQE15060.1 TetR/AcrR family transcriptional regulator [Trinickia caryophylli]SMF07860.1 transcriptional regulator, TetR family [Trinickia caryophylli]GLU31206.1 TetR family transcriptional regulator [Trinickia caryophylli]
MNHRSTRELIVTAADRLFYERGYEHTSFSDIADAVGISRGNFYHHFKSKDEILDAVIDLRLGNTRAMLGDWERRGKSPHDRIERFVRILIVNRSKIMKHGCPVGTLCAELAKLDHALRHRANELLTLFRAWLAEQFTALGHEHDADRLAMHLLARAQGVASLASAFHDERFIEQEVGQMLDWVSAVTPKRRARRGIHTP